MNEYAGQLGQFATGEILNPNTADTMVFEQGYYLVDYRDKPEYVGIVLLVVMVIQRICNVAGMVATKYYTSSLLTAQPDKTVSCSWSPDNKESFKRSLAIKCSTSGLLRVSVSWYPTGRISVR
jgi:hypothetical protein